MATKHVNQQNLELDVVETYDEALDEGYFGVKVDPNPNEVYTFAGSAARSKELFEKTKPDTKPAPGHNPLPKPTPREK